MSIARIGISIGGVTLATGSYTNADIGSTYAFQNVGEGDETTYFWEYVDQPSGSALTFNSPTLENQNISPTHEGSLRIRLTVDDGLPTESSDTRILAVRDMKSKQRIPAFDEEAEAGHADGWADDVNKMLNYLLDRATDPSTMVGMVVETVLPFLPSGYVCRQHGKVRIKSGLGSEEWVPVMTRVSATSSADMDQQLYILVDDVVTPGQSAVFSGSLGIFRRSGLTNFGQSGSPSLLAPVYVNNDGLTSLIPGTIKRRIGTVTAISSSKYDYEVEAGAMLDLPQTNYSHTASAVLFGNTGSRVDTDFPGFYYDKVNKALTVGVSGTGNSRIGFVRFGESVQAGQGHAALWHVTKGATSDYFIAASSAGTVMLNTSGAGTIDLQLGSTTIWRMDASGHLIPQGASATYNLGSSTRTVAQGFFGAGGIDVGGFSFREVGGGQDGTITSVGNLNLGAGSSTRWKISGSGGHLVPTGYYTQDIGSLTNPINSGTFGFIMAGDNIIVTSDSIHRTTGAMRIGSLGALRWQVNSTAFSPESPFNYDLGSTTAQVQDGHFSRNVYVTGTLRLASTVQSSVGAAGSASALPATPLGYFTVQIHGVNRILPYYAVS